jgi:hypothetical protein
MKRRNLIFGLLAVATLRSAHAQQSGKVHRIAYVRPAGTATQFTETAGPPNFQGTPGSPMLVPHSITR